MSDLENQDLDTQELEHQEKQIEIEPEAQEEPGNDAEPNIDDNPSDEEDEFYVAIGDEEPTPKPDDSSTIRHLREVERKKSKRIKELEEQLAQNQSTENKPVELGDEPTLEGAGYDTELYQQQYKDWIQRKSEHEQQQELEQQRKQKDEQDWQQRINEYEQKKTQLKAKVKDFEEAEEIAREVLSVQQQGVLIQGAENPELIVYALGKNHAKAKELAAITDPIKFAFAVAKLETQVKVQQRKPQTQPERKPSGSAQLSGAVDAKLDALEKEADRTGDRTKVIAYKRSLKK